MSEVIENLEKFVKYVSILDGDEKGEAQVFCDRLFQGFGHKGYKEAGATLEKRLKNDTGGTSFADLLWSPRVLIEMKKSGANLLHHYKQAFDYWVHAVPNRPRYVVLCNFDEFWIYDFDKQLNEPVDKVRTEELPKRFAALNFLFPEDPDPIFGNDLEAVSRETADLVAKLFNSLVERGIKRETAQRFVLQAIVAMFSEDIGLLPSNIVYTLTRDCLEKKQSSYDLFKGLFEQMNSTEPAQGGRYKDVPYFNGGLFKTIEPIDLKKKELGFLQEASKTDWSKVNPAIFGTIFQQSMDEEERHALGAHYTSEADLQRVVNPTIVKPLQQKIQKAKTLKDLLAVRSELMKFKVLDPACGSGNFLYVSYRELARLETELLLKIKSKFSEKEIEKQVKTSSLISPKNFHGIDIDPFGVELTKVTLMLAKKLALDEAQKALGHEQEEIFFGEESALPLDNLDQNIVCADSLFTEWPEVDAIVSNPPYQSKNKMQKEFGRAYVNSLREAFPKVPGRADYCVYWFRKAHDHLKKGQRAGLVGTNTIRQNYSREGSLDYIVQNGGTITEAVSTQVWSGDAVVHVSIVNWVKGKEGGKKTLFKQIGDSKNSPWEKIQLNSIPSSLSFNFDVTSAHVLNSSRKPKSCFQGQTHGHIGFLLSKTEADGFIKADKKNIEIIFPYLIANELLSKTDPQPERYVIDFDSLEQMEAMVYKVIFEKIRKDVLPTRVAAAEEEKERNEKAKKDNPDAKIADDHQQILGRWWQLFRPRPQLFRKINSKTRYIVCGRVTKRPIFEFISTTIHPNDALAVFAFNDDYSFGVLQSDIHWMWFQAKCSTLKGDFRYTSNSVFDTFPWPQNPKLVNVKRVATIAKELRILRSKLIKKYDFSLRALYASMENPGKHPLKSKHIELNKAVASAYGFPLTKDPLKLLFDLNNKLADLEIKGDFQKITKPGLPPNIKNPKNFVSSDCII